MDFTDVVRQRRMVHVFEQRQLEPTLVDDLLDLARRGPSAGFSQGIDFLVLDEPATVGRFWELVDDPQFPRKPGELEAAPPVLVIAVADPGRYVERYSRPDKIAFGLDDTEAWPVKFWDTDTAMACMVLLLAAVDAGLGGWFFGIGYGELEVRREFGIPADRNIVGVVGLGHPGIDTAPRGSAYSLRRRPFADQIHRNHFAAVQTVHEAAGGDEGLLRLANAWHARVMADEVVSHAFSHGFHPDHGQRLAAYWAEALGGPTTFTERYGDETSVVVIHSGNGPHDDMDRRAIACFDVALDDVGLRGEVRRVLQDYFAWATTTTMSRYHDSADDVPEGLPIPQWSWHGLVWADDG